jgi:hypothetical protein
MVILGNILKVVAAIIIGYIVGFILGSILGALFGVFISFLIPEVISPHQATLVSLFISLTLGSLLSSFVSQVFNRLLETNINSFIGAIPGALIGLVIVVFIYGYVDVSDPDNYYGRFSVNHLALTPVMPYSAKIGGQIGAITFALFGAVGIIREIIQSHLQLQRNRRLIKNSSSSNWGLPEIPRETPPIQANPTTHSFLSLQSRITSAKGRIIFFLLKAFVYACAIGIILSIAGWQIPGWNSGAQFSEGFFLTSALLAMYGYFNILGGHRASRNIATRYGETAGDMNLHERTRHWATEAETSFAPFPNIFLISACLFGFAILISIIF